MRIILGLDWFGDAWFKWQPDFIHNFETYLNGSLDDQPDWVASWIKFWVDIVNVNPYIFAYFIAIGETAVALGLILGVFSNLTNIFGFLLAFSMA